MFERFLAPNWRALGRVVSPNLVPRLLLTVRTPRPTQPARKVAVSAFWRGRLQEVNPQLIPGSRESSKIGNIYRLAHEP